uniref:F-box domain-containing protein n=1 Tax=Steinernema glaseri TaxID=37863 RepID=A0A1I7YFE4_9BILA
MDRVPVLFVQELCRQLTTKHSSDLEKLSFWGNVSRNFFSGHRKVSCYIYCKTKNYDIRVRLWEESEVVTPEELKSLSNIDLEYVGVFINNSVIVDDHLTPSYAAQLLKLCAKQCFHTEIKLYSINPPSSLLAFPVLQQFIMSLQRIHFIDFDNLQLIEAIARRAAERGTLRVMSLRSLELDSDLYKEVLRKFNNYSSLKLIRYCNLIKPNIELSDEEKAHFRMEKRLKEYAIDFLRICD